MTGLALDALQAVLVDKEAPATAIVAAARVLLDFGGSSARQDLGERVAAIEAALKRRERSNK
jgi:hypothetical protein